MTEEDVSYRVTPPHWWEFKKRREIARADLIAEVLLIVSMARRPHDEEIDTMLSAIIQDLKTLETRIAAAEQGVASLPPILTAWAETIGKHLAYIELLAKHHGKTGGDA